MCVNWQTDSSAFLEIQRIDSIQDSLKDEQDGRN